MRPTVTRDRFLHEFVKSDTPKPESIRKQLKRWSDKLHDLGLPLDGVREIAQTARLPEIGLAFEVRTSASDWTPVETEGVVSSEDLEDMNVYPPRDE